MKAIGPARTIILDTIERDLAETIGAGVYLRSLRYRTFREQHFFAALDAGVETMKHLQVANPYDGRTLGALARVMLRADPKAVGVLRKRKVAALDDPNDREELFTLAGVLIAEQYLRARKDDMPTQARLAPACAVLDALEQLFEQMRDEGRQMAAKNVANGEMGVTLAGMQDPDEVARELIAEAAGAYESLVPQAEEGGIPDPVQRRSISKAAFLRLSVEELDSLAAAEGFGGLPNKTAIADALAERHGQDLQEVAKMVIREADGDPGFGLVTRLLPLLSNPDLDACERAFTALQGRYFEPRLAVFFLFGPVTRTQDTVRVSGRITSFTVNPMEAAGEAQIYAKPSTQDVTIVLRTGTRWAELDSRRASDMRVLATVLRRSGEVRPAGGVTPPAALTGEPYNAWDARTLWVLEFLRRDLQAPALKLDDTLMANFVSPDTTVTAGGPDGERRPSLQAVRLLGSQLHEHPEACARIASCAHLRDIEVRIRKITDQATGTSRLIRVRLSWEADHLAVLSGASNADTFESAVHQQLVALVRSAGSRALSEPNLEPMLGQIQRRASDGEIPNDGSRVIEEPADGIPTGAAAAP